MGVRLAERGKLLAAPVIVPSAKDENGKGISDGFFVLVVKEIDKGGTEKGKVKRSVRLLVTAERKEKMIRKKRKND